MRIWEEGLSSFNIYFLGSIFTPSNQKILAQRKLCAPKSPTGQLALWYTVDLKKKTHRIVVFISFQWIYSDLIFFLIPRLSPKYILCLIKSLLLSFLVPYFVVLYYFLSPILQPFSLFFRILKIFFCSTLVSPSMEVCNKLLQNNLTFQFLSLSLHLALLSD